MAVRLTKGLFFGTGGAVLLTYGARKYRETFFRDRHEGALVHKDKSTVSIPIKSQVPATVQIIYPTKAADGETLVTIVDKKKVMYKHLQQQQKQTYSQLIYKCP